MGRNNGSLVWNDAHTLAEIIAWSAALRRESQPLDEVLEINDHLDRAE